MQNEGNMVITLASQDVTDQIKGVIAKTSITLIDCSAVYTNIHNFSFDSSVKLLLLSYFLYIDSYKKSKPRQ